MLVGEMIGEFIGNFVYEIFNGDDQNVKGKALLKKKFDQLINGIGKGGKMFFNFMVSMVGKAGNFIKDGVDRFIKNFPIISEKVLYGSPNIIKMYLVFINNTVLFEFFIK